MHQSKLLHALCVVAGCRIHHLLDEEQCYYEWCGAGIVGGLVRLNNGRRYTAEN